VFKGNEYRRISPAWTAAWRVLALCKLGLWVSIASSFMLMGCSGTAAFSETDEIAIYSAVIHRIYTQDDTFSGTYRAPVIYLLTATDDSVGDPNIEQSESQGISLSVQTEIEHALVDLPVQVVWVDDFPSVPIDPDSGEVIDRGAVLTLGNIHIQGDGTALVSASIYVAFLAAGGQTYILEQSNENWKITGTTDVSWIS